MYGPERARRGRSGVRSASPAHALAQKPAIDAETRFATGLIHLREGRVDLALEEFKKAVKEDDKNPYFHKGLGHAYAPASASARTRSRAFRKALELNPYYVDVRNDLGMALDRSGQAGGRARRSSSTAFSDPTNPTPEISARNLGQAYLEEKNYAEAINWFRTAIGRNKVYADPYLGLADALMAPGASRKRWPSSRREWPRSPPTPGSTSPWVRRSSRPVASPRPAPSSRRRSRRTRRARWAARRRRSSRRSRGRRPVPYLRILETPARAAPGARTALLLDAQGEVVVEAGDLGERHRLIGAYQGIALGTASRTAERYDVGDMRTLVPATTAARSCSRRSRTTTTWSSRSSRARSPPPRPATAEEARERLDQEL